MSLENLEEISFRNLVLFYAKELKAMQNGEKPFTKSEKRALCKHGVCRRGIVNRCPTVTASVLTPRAKGVLSEA